MRRYLLFTVFVSGMTTLAAELAAGRLIGNVFGTSNIVWASIIGLILIYLTLGYFLGGRWADANPTPGAMYRALAWGAFTLGLVPYIAGPVLRSAATAFESLQIVPALQCLPLDPGEGPTDQHERHDPEEKASLQCSGHEAS